MTLRERDRFWFSTGIERRKLSKRVQVHPWALWMLDWECGIDWGLSCSRFSRATVIVSSLPFELVQIAPLGSLGMGSEFLESVWNVAECWFFSCSILFCQGFTRNADNTNQPHMGPVNQGQSLFADANQRLINMGFPRWNLGNQVIEPVMSVIAVLMLMFFGMRGLVLIGGLYLFSRFSQR